jgi:hypothetical protein
MLGWRQLDGLPPKMHLSLHCPVSARPGASPTRDHAIVDRTIFSQETHSSTGRLLDSLNGRVDCRNAESGGRAE